MVHHEALERLTSLNLSFYVSSLSPCFNSFFYLKNLNILRPTLKSLSLLHNQLALGITPTCKTSFKNRINYANKTDGFDLIYHTSCPHHIALSWIIKIFNLLLLSCRTNFAYVPLDKMAAAGRRQSFKTFPAFRLCPCRLDLPLLRPLPNIQSRVVRFFVQRRRCRICRSRTCQFPPPLTEGHRDPVDLNGCLQRSGCRHGHSTGH